MVLKETKGQAKRTPAIDDASSILAKIEQLNVSGLFKQLKAYLDPLRKFEDSAGKENGVNSEKHRTAKQYVPFLAQVLKLCSSSLSRLPIKDDDGTISKADELFSSMSLALDCFECLRHWLVGCPFEIEIQRSWFVRRLMAWKRFSEALIQNLSVIRSLCRGVLSGKKAGFSSPMAGLKCKEGLMNDMPTSLPPPERAQELTPGLVALVVGVATDLVVCMAEIGAEDLAIFEKVLALPHELEPWLRELEVEKVEKQRCLLFKGLHKCLLALIADPACYNLKLIETFCTLTLHQCAFCSMRDHFCKVARSVCSRLSSQGPECSELAFNICADALAKLSQIEQLQGLRCSHEALDLIEYYARLCQTAKRNKDGWFYICKAIHQTAQDSSASFVSVGGLYAVGLVLATKASDTVDEKATSQLSSRWSVDTKLLHETCMVLQGALEAVQHFLTHLWPGTKSEFEDETYPVTMDKSFKIDDQKETSKSFLSVYRALDFIRRVSASYAQHKWDAFITKSEELPHSSAFNCSLEHALLLFCKSVKIGLRCGSLCPDEREAFQKGSQSLFLAASAALRLSLLGHDGVKESVTMIKRSMSDPFVRSEELRWLMSSTYNMGVQLFNVKHYSLVNQPWEG